MKSLARKVKRGLTLTRKPAIETGITRLLPNFSLRREGRSLWSERALEDKSNIVTIIKDPLSPVRHNGFVQVTHASVVAEKKKKKKKKAFPSFVAVWQSTKERLRTKARGFVTAAWLTRRKQLNAHFVHHRRYTGRPNWPGGQTAVK